MSSPGASGSRSACRGPPARSLRLPAASGGGWVGRGVDPRSPARRERQVAAAEDGAAEPGESARPWSPPGGVTNVKTCCRSIQEVAEGRKKVPLPIRK